MPRGGRPGSPGESLSKKAPKDFCEKFGKTRHNSKNKRNTNEQQMSVKHSNTAYVAFPLSADMGEEAGILKGMCL